jgi:hypothetical protein
LSHSLRPKVGIVSKNRPPLFPINIFNSSLLNNLCWRDNIVKAKLSPSLSTSPIKRKRKLDVKLYAFLVSVPDGCQQSASHLECFTPEMGQTLSLKPKAD